jgi:23S rRNA pseudouridine1911/1915/1917 synthase
MLIDILYENSDLVVINKPAGLRTHGDGKSVVPTVVDWVLEHYPEIAGVGEPMLVDGKVLDRPGIVHRLDEETSGALIIAKHQKLFEYLKQQFKDRLVTKEYHAFVWGHFKETQGTVDVPIGRNKNDFRRWHAGRGVRGEAREALTKWQVITQFTDDDGQAFSLMHLWPKTGRTHQLRVHMKYLQRPIVSDTLYAPTLPDALGFDRVALHAHSISFVTPGGEKLQLTAPYPVDFERAVGQASKALARDVLL